jgi:hypothetical protein
MRTQDRNPLLHVSAADRRHQGATPIFKTSRIMTKFVALKELMSHHC